MASLDLPNTPWRDAMLPASFRGVHFFAELSGKAGGRRIALHEFPKRDTPFAEDMGRRAHRYTMSAYILGLNYISDRDALIAALDASGTGTLVYPTLGTFTVNVDSYACSETRERGGICTFEMTFVEAGSLQGSGATTVDTGQAAKGAATDLGKSSATSLDAAGSKDTGVISI